MIRTAGVLLVFAFTLASARDLVCQAACATPESAHAAAACHEGGDMGGTQFESVKSHCIELDNELATAATKLKAVPNPSLGLATHLSLAVRPVPPTSRKHLLSTNHSHASVRSHETTVLRI